MILFDFIVTLTTICNTTRSIISFKIILKITIKMKEAVIKIKNILKKYIKVMRVTK